MIIAIDGPAGSGKSSTARVIASRLNGFYLDTGAMYRAIGIALLQREIMDPDQAADAVANMQLELRSDESGVGILVDGVDVTNEIRTPEASEQASRISKLLPVRKKLVSEQRRIGHRLSEAGQVVVVEGRDIGTVVFPDASVKFFMDADPKVRARRRYRELQEDGRAEDLESVLAEIEHRDKQDREREHSPLRKAKDAIRVDTTGLTPEEQVDMMLAAIDDGSVRKERRGR